MKHASKLVLTVVLVGGVAGAVAAYNHGPMCGAWANAWGSPEHRADHLVNRLAGKLELDPAQRGQLEALKTQLLELRQATHGQRSETRGAALALLDAPTLDQSQALALVAGKTERVRALAPEVVGALAAFTDSLSAEQRAELKQMVEKRMQRHHRHGQT